jgi:hypothetical protein
LLAITFLGFYTGVTSRTLFFEQSVEEDYKGKIDDDRIRLDTAQFPLGRGDEIFMVARVLAGNNLLTWVGIYGYGVEPTSGRPGGYKAVGVWLRETSVQPGPIVKVLRAAMRQLDAALDNVSTSQWKARFNGLTLDDLGFDQNASSELASGQVGLLPYRRERGAPAQALIDVSADTPAEEETALARALLEAQRDPPLAAADKVFITRRASTARLAERYGMRVFRPGQASQLIAGQAKGSGPARGEPPSAASRPTRGALAVASRPMPEGGFEVELETGIQDLRRRQGRLEADVDRLDSTISAIQADNRKTLAEASEKQRSETRRFVRNASLAQGAMLFAVVVLSNFHSVLRVGEDLFLTRTDKPAIAGPVAHTELRPGEGVPAGDPASGQEAPKDSSGPNAADGSGVGSKVMDGIAKAAAALTTSCSSPPASANRAANVAEGTAAGNQPPAVPAAVESFRAADCKVSVLEGIISTLNNEQITKPPEFVKLLQSMAGEIGRYREETKKARAKMNKP